MADKTQEVKSADPNHGPAVIDLEAAQAAEIKIPADLSRVSDSKARELVEAGAVEDRDLPAKMYKRKSDGFVARIPNYTWNAYAPDLQDQWAEIKLTSDPAA